MAAGFSVTARIWHPRTDAPVSDGAAKQEVLGVYGGDAAFKVGSSGGSVLEAGTRHWLSALHLTGPAAGGPCDSDRSGRQHDHRLSADRPRKNRGGVAGAARDTAPRRRRRSSPQWFWPWTWNVVCVRCSHRSGSRVSPSGHYAYTGGTSEEVKRAIRKDIRGGRQRVVIAAPRSHPDRAQPALDDAARQGYLTHLIIDEAHLVEQWGNEFRPEFQAMSGQRRSWLAIAPPRP